jgi:hypothetical protein
MAHPGGRILARRSDPTGACRRDHRVMARHSPIRRLALIPASGPQDPIRRYRLARLEDVAWGSEPDHVHERRRTPPAEEDGAPGDAPGVAWQP